MSLKLIRHSHLKKKNPREEEDKSENIQNEAQRSRVEISEIDLKT